jgi:alkanesulfonate monooxygenase SsuD/methylene tetrahydromethanopterin reductase-like flavin-dependent oxidoreductase (luciferase family)
MVPNALQFLAYWAGRTSRIGLGTIVLVLPWHHPIQTAHEIAMLDVLLQGRPYTLGVGRGLSAKEFDPLGIPQEQARQRFDEALDIIRLGLSQERFSYEGQIFKIPPTSIRPRPRHDDLIAGAVGAFMTPTSLEALARSGLGPVVLTLDSLDQVGRDMETFNAIRSEAGYQPDAQPIVYAFGYCAETEEEAQAGYRFQRVPDAANHYGFRDTSKFAATKGYEQYANIIQRSNESVAASEDGITEAMRSQLVGTPEQIIQKAQEMQRLTSAKEIVVLFNYGGMPVSDSIRSMKLFAEEVLPAIHAMPTPQHHGLGLASQRA